MFDIRQHLIGHEKDVRCIGELKSEGEALCIISGSRDGTVRVWKEKKDGNSMSFEECHCIKNENVCVTAVCQMPASAFYPDSAIVAAFDDRKIRFYNGKSFQLLNVLEGHDGRVCCLAVNGETGELASGSWDCTARVWSPSGEQKVFYGHSGAVWAVSFLPFDGRHRLLSGSADKIIMLWADETVLLRSFFGHKDCIRDLHVLPDANFLSCSNDGTICLWDTVSGNLIRQYTGHDHFIFSISSVGTLPWFASGSEDHTVRVWEKSSSKCLQTLRLPCQTVWEVVVLTNGDIACACSDATIRIFSCDDKRKAIPEKLTGYEQLLAAFELSLQANDRASKSNYSDLPSVDILNRPGDRDGQTLLVRDSKDRLQAFSWSMEEERWNCVGPAIEKSIELKKKEKTLYEGKEYDCVFEIDVADDQPHLKLPYNFGDDPWTAAQQFIGKHGLPLSYLEKVANFIIENSSRVANQASFATTSIDPFTGTSRYIAGTDDERKKFEGDVDPFTGSARYIPSDNNDLEAPMFDPLKPRGCGMPLREYYKFNIVNAEGLAAKLRMFNTLVKPEVAIEPGYLILLECFTRNTEGERINDDTLDILVTCLSWPEEFLLPVVDCLRLVLLNERGNTYFFGVRSDIGLAGKLSTFIGANPTEKQSSEMLLVVVLRALANSFAHQAGRDAMYACDENFWAPVCEALKVKKPSVQTAASAALANVTYLYATQANRLETTDRKVRLLGIFVGKLAEMFHADNVTFDSAVLVRILQSLASLLWGDPDAVKYAKVMETKFVLSKLGAKATDYKERNMVSSIESMLEAID